jgi:hypothetical protein
LRAVSIVTLVQNAACNTLEVKLRGRPLSIDVLPEMTGDEVFGINEQRSKLHSNQIAFLVGEILLVFKANLVIDTVTKLMVRLLEIVN